MTATALRRLVPIAALSMLLFVDSISCVRSKGIIPEKKLITLLADLEVAEAYSRMAADSRFQGRDSIGLAVLKSYGYTPDQLDSTLGWYGKNVDLYQELYAKVERELDHKMKEVSKNLVNKDVGDQNELWTFPTHAAIGSDGMAGALTFSIPTLGITPGDVVVWRMHPVQGNVEVLLGAEYQDGENLYLVSNMYASNTAEVILNTDSTRKVERLYGILRPIGLESRMERFLVDSISLKVRSADGETYYRTRHMSRF